MHPYEVENFMPKDPETFGEYRLAYRTGDIVSPRIEIAEPLGVELRDFCQAIRTRSTPRSSAELGLEVVRTIEAVDASLGRNGACIEVGSAELVAAASRPRSSPLNPDPELPQRAIVWGRRPS